MSKKNTYFTILAVALIIIALGFAMPITAVKSYVNILIKMVSSPYVFAPAAICAFIFMNTKNYWFINLGCAMATALAIQFLVTKTGFNLETFALRSFAFLIVVYILNLIKVILNK